MEITLFDSNVETKDDYFKIFLKIGLKSPKVSDININFIIDIAQNLNNIKKVFPINAQIKYTTFNNDITILNIDIPQFNFNNSLSYDELTNMCAIQLIWKINNEEFTLMIPIFCETNSNNEKIKIEIISPIC